MKNTQRPCTHHLSITLFVFALIALAKNSECRGLSSDYRLVQDEITAMQKDVGDYEKALNQLNTDLEKAKRLYLRCPNQKWRIFFESVRPKAESSYRQLVALNVKIERLRRRIESGFRQLEMKKSKIEATYSNSDQRYDAAFREYMKNLKVYYVERMRNEIFYCYDQYDSGVLKYMKIIGINNRTCPTKDSDRSVLEEVSVLVDGISEATYNIDKILAR